jgi:cytochrome c biogenesis protein CcdA
VGWPLRPGLVDPIGNDALQRRTDIRTIAAQTHQPVVIFAMLFALVLVSALLVGYGMGGVASRNWVHMIGFVVAVAVVIYGILDLEFPRVGPIRLDHFDGALEELRQTMV